MGTSKDEWFVNCDCHMYYKLGLVLQLCNPATWEAEAGEAQVQDQLRQQLNRNLSQKVTGCRSVVKHLSSIH